MINFSTPKIKPDYSISVFYSTSRDKRMDSKERCDCIFQPAIAMKLDLQLDGLLSSVRDVLFHYSWLGLGSLRLQSEKVETADFSLFVYNINNNSRPNTISSKISTPPFPFLYISRSRAFSTHPQQSFLYRFCTGYVDNGYSVSKVKFLQRREFAPKRDERYCV